MSATATGIRDAGEAPDLADVIKMINGAGGGSTLAAGASEADKVKRFIKAYRNYLISIYGMKGGITPWHKKLMATAAKQEIAPSVFVTLIRRYDPRYVRTDEYKDRTAAATTSWKRWFPDQQPPPNFSREFARSTHSGAWLQRRIESSAAVRKEYRFLNVAAKAGSAAGSDPGAYRAYRDALNASYRNYLKREATPLEQRMMFSSGMTDNEFQAALANVFGGAGSFQWAQGFVPQTKQLQAAAFGAKGGNPLYAAIAGARGSQERFMKSAAKPFDMGLDEETGAIVMSHI